MARQADYGLMIRDRKSKGTLNNIRSLLSHGRPVIGFPHPHQSFYTLHSAEDFAIALS